MLSGSRVCSNLSLPLRDTGLSVATQGRHSSPLCTIWVGSPGWCVTQRQHSTSHLLGWDTNTHTHSSSPTDRVRLGDLHLTVTFWIFTHFAWGFRSFFKSQSCLNRNYYRFLCFSIFRRATGVSRARPDFHACSHFPVWAWSFNLMAESGKPSDCSSLRGEQIFWDRDSWWCINYFSQIFSLQGKTK